MADTTEKTNPTKPVDKDEALTLHEGEPEQEGRRSLSRTLAVLVLIPAVPGLLGSIGAMLLFYVSPARFNKLLALLPGETILRSLLFFAPSALFAVVFLAVLYARQGSASANVSETAHAGSPVLVQFAARTGLIFGVPGMLGATALLLLSFVSPALYEAFLDPLPGTRYLDALMPFIPLGLLFIVIPALLVVTNLVSFGRRTERRRAAGDAAAKFSRALVLVILVPSVLLLIMAVAALGLSYVSPPHFAKLLARLTSEGVIRLGMLFGFSALLAVVLISSLFLLMRPGRTEGNLEQTERSEVQDPPNSGAASPQTPGLKPGSTTLVWFLSTGLFFTVTSSAALFGVALYLLLR